MTDGLLKANKIERREYLKARTELTKLLDEGSLGSARNMLDNDKRLNRIYELAENDRQ